MTPRIFYEMVAVITILLTPANSLAQTGLDETKLYCAKNVETPCMPSPGDTTPAPGDGVVNGTMWPTRTIPVALSPTVSSNPQLSGAILAALKHIQTRTGLQFYACSESALQAAPESFGYMYIDDSRGRCFSNNVGYAPNNVSLTDACVAGNPRRNCVQIGGGACDANNTGGIAHEILHELGLDHEQLNPHRGATINIDATDPNNRPEPFYTISHTYFSGKDYDPASIMHYPCTYFSGGSTRFIEKGPDFAKLQKKFQQIYPFQFNIVDSGKTSCKSIIGEANCISKVDAEGIKTLFDSYGSMLKCDRFGISKIPFGCSKL